jgi:hypothetical protein
MEILGPSQIALTMNTYARLIQELRRNAAERIEASNNPLAIIRHAGEGWLPPGGGEVSPCWVCLSCPKNSTLGQRSEDHKEYDRSDKR